jgi:hypothetical protein
MLSKLEGGAARLALVVQLGRWASGESVDPARIDAESMTRGVTLARWFTAEASRVYAMMDESESDRADRDLVNFIKRKGGSATKRDLMQADRKRFPTAGHAQDVLDGLVADEIGIWDRSKTSSAGGRPEDRFVLSKTHNPR